MVEDQDPVIVAEGPGKADDAVGRRADAALRGVVAKLSPRERTPLSLTAPRPSSTAALDGQRVSERRTRPAARRARRDARARPLGLKRAAGQRASRPALRLFAADLLGLLAGGDGDVARAERLATGGERLLDRALLQRSELLPLRPRAPGGFARSSARAPSAAALEPLPFGELRRQRAGPAADHRQRGIEQHADLDELVDAAAVGERQQRRSLRP